MEAKLLTRVRALLAQAENTTYPEEAATFTARAHELMARHGIEQAQLDATGAIHETIKTIRVDMDGSYTTRKAQLLSAVAKACRCKSIRYHAAGSSATIYAMVVGYESDLDRVEMLYTSLLLQAAGQIAHQRPDRRSGVSVAAYRSGWFVGFTNEVSDRLKKIEAQAVATAQAEQAASGTGVSTELVLVDRAAKVELAFDQTFPDAISAKHRPVNYSAYHAGRAAGQRADLGQTRVGGSQTAIG